MITFMDDSKAVKGVSTTKNKVVLVEDSLGRKCEEEFADIHCTQCRIQHYLQVNSKNSSSFRKLRRKLDWPKRLP